MLLVWAWRGPRRIVNSIAFLLMLLVSLRVVSALARPDEERREGVLNAVGAVLAAITRHRQISVKMGPRFTSNSRLLGVDSSTNNDQSHGGCL